MPIASMRRPSKDQTNKIILQKCIEIDPENTSEIFIVYVSCTYLSYLLIIVYLNKTYQPKFCGGYLFKMNEKRMQEVAYIQEG